MKKTSTFSDALEAANNLSLDAKEQLIEILRKRNIEQRRNELAAEIRSARSDFKHGRCKATTTDDIMTEILL
jgi:predicted XRE-type DNA-binding protein